MFLLKLLLVLKKVSNKQIEVHELVIKYRENYLEYNFGLPAGNPKYEFRVSGSWKS